MAFLPAFFGSQPNHPLSQLFGQVGTVPSLIVNRDPMQAAKIGMRNGAIAGMAGGAGMFPGGAMGAGAGKGGAGMAGPDPTQVLAQLLQQSGQRR